jgi:N-acylglucosamine-6-phosphate 2-epimerase
MKAEIECLRGGLIVSCQAPPGSPLDDPHIISAFALTAEQNGAVAVRINGSAQIAVVRQKVKVPILGIEKVLSAESEVYITPTYEAARRIVESGANIVALDATRRPRPGGERIEDLIRQVREELCRPVMADVATYEEGVYAAECGAEIVATTLCGFTSETAGTATPAFRLLERLAAELSVPVICEGGISTPEQARRAFDCGAFAIVVGAAITALDQRVRLFVAATPSSRGD